MSGTWAMVLREVTERRAFLAAAAVAALIPVVVPVLPGLFASSAADIRGALAWGLAVLLGWIMAVMLGTSMVAGDLGQGRASFLFSQPVGEAAIWIAKVAGNLMVVVAVQLIVLLPAVLVSGGETPFDFSGEPWWSIPVLLVGCPLSLLLASHVVSVMFRARSAWIVADGVAFLVALFAGWGLFWSWAAVAPGVAVSGLMTIAVALVVFMFAAGCYQVVRGRTDLRQGHRAMSLVLWSGVLATVLVLAGVSAWLRGVSPGELLRIDMVTAGGGGDWVAVAGVSKRCTMHHPTFFYNLADGRWRSFVTTAAWGDADVEFSSDGRTAVWLAPAGRDTFQLMVADLAGPEPRFRELGLVFRDWVEYAISPDGFRVAVVESGTLSVVDVATGKLLAAKRIEGFGKTARIVFAGSEIVRLAVMRRGPTGIDAVTILQFDPASRELTTLFRREHAGPWSFPRWSPDLGRWLIAKAGTADTREWRLFSVQGPVEGIPVGSFHRHVQVVFLNDGSMAVAEVVDGRVTISHVGVSGEVMHSYDLGAASRLRLGIEVRPGLLVYATRMADGDTEPVSGYQARTVDLQTGAVTDIDKAGFPVASWYASAGEQLPNALVGRLFYHDEKSLTVWDPGAGKTKVVLGGSS